MKAYEVDLFRKSRDSTLNKPILSKVIQANTAKEAFITALRKFQNNKSRITEAQMVMPGVQIFHTIEYQARIRVLPDTWAYNVMSNE